jgi:inorganic triphosphatase YgiF
MRGGQKKMERSTEQEWQFSAPELDAARAWLAAQPVEISDRRLSIQPTLELTDIYYDSPDWMIFRAGFALRMRSERTEEDGEQTEVTLKSLSKPHNALARRTEFSQRVDGSDMDAVIASAMGIGERIRELIGERSLKPLFKANTRRERQRLLEAGSDIALAEVDLDETSIEATSGVSTQLKRIEVECLNATPAALEPFVRQLRDAAQLEPVEMSKFRVGLKAAGLNPPGQERASLEVSAAQPFAETQFALLRRYFALMPGEGTAGPRGFAAALHEMRVAARHLDVLLRLFSSYGPRWARDHAAPFAHSSGRSAACATATCSSSICALRLRGGKIVISPPCNLCASVSRSSAPRPAPACCMPWIRREHAPGLRTGWINCDSAPTALQGLAPPPLRW